MKSAIGQGVLALVILALVGWPAVATVLEALRNPTPVYTDASGGLARPAGLAATTVQLVLITELIALPLGVTLGWFLFRTDLWGRRALIALMVLALFVPMPLHALGWLGSFGNLGRSQAFGSRPILNGLWGAGFVHAIAALPWVTLLSGVGFSAVERELEESAWLDLPAWRVAVQISFRRAIGSIAAAALAVAVLTAGDMTVTDLVNPQVRTYAEEAYTLSQLGASPALVALPVLVVLGIALLLAASALLRIDPARVPMPGVQPRLWLLHKARIPLSILVWLIVGNALLLPIYGLVWRAGRVGGTPGHPPRWSLSGLLGTLPRSWSTVAEPLAETILWSALGATLATAFAWGLAWVSRRPGPWRWLTALAITVALAAPGPVAGMALKLAYNPPNLTPGASFLGRLDFYGRAWVHDSPALLVLGLCLRTFPFAFLILWPAIRSIPAQFLEAATLEGYGPAGLIRRVAVPLTRRAVLAAWITSLILGVGELPISYLVSTPGHTPLSLVVWGLLHTGVESHLAGVGLILLGLIAVLGFIAFWAFRRTIRVTIT